MESSFKLQLSNIKPAKVKALSSFFTTDSSSDLVDKNLALFISLISNAGGLRLEFFDTSKSFFCELINCSFLLFFSMMPKPRHGHWEQVTLRATSKRQSRARCNE